MLKSVEEEKQTLDKTSTNDNDTTINLLPKEGLLSAITQSQLQSNRNVSKLQASENYDLTKEQNSSSGEWGEEKSDPNNNKNFVLLDKDWLDQWKIIVNQEKQYK